MQIEKNAVVDIDYTLTDDNGNVLDTSEGRDCMSYLHGSGQIIPGLERELEGQEVGADLKVAVAPEDGYGERNESLLQTVTRDQFEEVDDLAVGMQFRVDSNAGPMVITIVKIEDNDITIDGNHPLAGVNLNFTVTVRNIREATAEEIDHGHAHGPDEQEH
ncbi:MAG: peptidylprolyl isomerase [Pirellulaceae bacterium]|nr:peptidylprolyl isomerase [Pirellulaceae bacterium]